MEANKTGSTEILRELGEAEPQLRLLPKHRVNLLLGGSFIIESMTILLSLTSYFVIKWIATFNVDKIFLREYFFCFLITW